MRLALLDSKKGLHTIIYKHHVIIFFFNTEPALLIVENEKVNTILLQTHSIVNKKRKEIMLWGVQRICGLIELFSCRQPAQSVLQLTVP
jgi:hypothetical protein